ncbi:MAG: hypothetical protein JNK05_06660 [Myxococcales bacterium]|nr:hypothetical protein [Myxococcales bacterium]
MNSTLTRRLASGTSLAVAAIALSACAPNYASVEIRQLVVPQPNPQVPGACFGSADPNAPKVLSSVLDLALRDNYTAIALVQNNMFRNRSVDLNRPDTRSVFAQYVDVELTTSAGQALTLPGGAPALYRINVRGDLIETAPGGLPGYGVLEMPVITATQGAALRDRLGCTGFVAGTPPEPFCRNDSITVQVTLRPTFRTLGGDILTSERSSPWTNVRPYSFPLTVCCGCLLTIPAGYTPACQPMSTMGTTMAPTGGSCIVGQDFPTSCTTCAGQPQCQRTGCP